MISAVVSINISRMDSQMASALAAGGEADAADAALLYAKADLARAVNYAGMEALKQMGETPVIEPDPASQYNPGGAEPDVALFNLNWARGMTAYTLNQYIESNYMYESYTHSGYAVNVEPLQGWDEITIAPIHMGLDRQLETPILPPNNTYVTYWKVTVPLTVEIVEMASGDVVDRQDIVVGNLVTSRYPLLEGLTSEYEVRLNGADAVMAETTGLAMAYTWARGFMQYYYKSKGTENIVTNEHLALIVNGALLTDQGFVFNSADPASIIEYAMQTQRTLSDKSDLDEAEFLAGMDLSNGSFQVDPQADAALSTGDAENATDAMEDAMHFDYNATPMTEYLNDASLPGGSTVSARIQAVIPRVYVTSLATDINRHTTIDYGDHDGYEKDYWREGWGEPDSMRKVGTVPRDPDVPGNLYGEIWEARWTRLHTWRHYYTVYYPCLKTRTYVCGHDEEGNAIKCTEEYWDTCSRIEYTEMTTIDKRTDRVTVTLRAKENSKTYIPLDYEGGSISTKNDVYDAYTSGDVSYSYAHTDPELEEAYLSYKSEYFSTPDMESYVSSRSLKGEINQKMYTLDAPGWLGTEAQYAVDEITEQIQRDVHLSPDINYREYPNPADAMRAAADDLTRKIEVKRQDYVDEDRYTNGGKYSSCSAKAICQLREWYVDQVLYEVNEQYVGAGDMIDGQIDDNFTDSADDVRSANDRGAQLLKDALSLPVGLGMRAEHVRADGTPYREDELAWWEENVTLAVDMEPDYLFEEPDGDKKLINLGVQNVCLFGPTGIPVLPPPNYVVQFNSWMINVEGRIDTFILQDVDDEVHPNPLWGHEAQIYLRTDDAIEDSTNNYIRIGYNTPIEFSFSTGTFIAVPPTGKPIGDRLGGIIETSSEYGEILGK